MRQSTVGLLLVIAFLVGVVACMAAKPIIVPPVRAGSNPALWEYTCLESWPHKSEDVAKMNEFGSQGWELVSNLFYANLVYSCFKRPLP